MSKIHEKINELDKALQAVEEIIFNGLVSWNSVKNWELGLSKTINKSINTLIYKEENIMIFETVIPPKTIFPMHWHDFKEQNFVISGVYSDNGKTFLKNDWVNYDVLVPHQVTNLSEDELKIIVIFTHVL